ncbi:MAG: hypothetical protein D9V47_11075 [Clostridia bacterium]|nr:MAG: hypothetical protein D9V47_11075 [Clostridia bacterium]
MSNQAYGHALLAAGIDARLVDLALEVEDEIAPVTRQVEATVRQNEIKVLQGFLAAGVTDFHFGESTGYGYGDLGRGTLDRLFATVFAGESALVRPQIVSGTHAIALCLEGLLEPGGELLLIGPVYPTLEKIAGRHGQAGSLARRGVKVRWLPLAEVMQDPGRAINPDTRLVAVQRSRGYAAAGGMTLEEIGDLIRQVKAVGSRVVLLVDNCYGEFVDVKEPLEMGADVIAGSLIKNPGGGLAPGGGYIVGRDELIERIGWRYTAPGLGRDIGANPAGYRLFYQGLFLAPRVVGEALKGAIFAAGFWDKLGFRVSPAGDARRVDIIQAVELGTAEGLLAFCRGLQKHSPVNSRFVPEPEMLPGYETEVIMAAGTFIQGGSLELSADAPWQPPYTVYLQGGLSAMYAELGNLGAAQEMLERGLLPQVGVGG